MNGLYPSALTSSRCLPAGRWRTKGGSGPEDLPSTSSSAGTAGWTVTITFPGSGGRDRTNQTAPEAASRPSATAAASGHRPILARPFPALVSGLLREVRRAAVGSPELSNAGVAACPGRRVRVCCGALISSARTEASTSMVGTSAAGAGSAPLPGRVRPVGVGGRTSVSASGARCHWGPGCSTSTVAATATVPLGPGCPRSASGEVRSGCCSPRPSQRRIRACSFSCSEWSSSRIQSASRRDPTGIPASWVNGRRSSCSSLHHWYRSCGSTASAASTTRESASGTAGFTPAGGGTSPLRTFSSTAKSLSPVKSLRPQISSQSSTPAAKTSLRWSTGPPRTCSGLM